MRDLLKVRKKLKKEDWKKIYFFANSRGYKKKQYSVYLNGTLIPWEKAWKEIRRSGALQTEMIEINEVDLPSGVVVKPSAGSGGFQVAAPSNKARTQAGSPVTMRSQNVEMDLGSLSAADTSSGLTALSSHIRSSGYQNQEQLTSLSATYIELILEALPWNRFRQAVLAHFNIGQTNISHINGIAFTYMPNDGFFPDLHQMILARVSDTVYPSIWDVFERRTPPAFSTAQQPWYQHFVMLIYVLSNGLGHTYVDGVKLFGLLAIVVDHLPAEVVTKVLRDNGSLVRAVWDHFVKLLAVLSPRYHWEHSEMDKRWPSAIFRIIEVFLHLYPEWIQASMDELLCRTVMLERPDLSRRLSNLGAKVPERDGGWMLANAALVGSLDYMQILADCCEINADGSTWLVVHMDDGISRSMDITCTPLVVFLHYFASPASTMPKIEESRILDSLQILLESGADVHAPFPLKLCGLYHRELFGRSDVRSDWQPTCLDISFYWSEIMFEQMRWYSTSATSTALHRSEVCTSIMAGDAALRAYLRSRIGYTPLEKQQFLEMVLLEQFFVEQHRSRIANLNEFSARLAIKLLDYGVEFESVPDSLPASALLRVWIRSVDEFGFTDDLDTILGRLASSPLSIIVTDKLIEDCVESEGTQMLELLSYSGVLRGLELAVVGALALVRAAQLDNYEAVSWLLDRGVDINAEFMDTLEKSKRSCTVIFHCFRSSSDLISLDMFRHLVSRSAKLRSSLKDENCYELLESALVAYFFASKSEKAIYECFQIFSDEIHDITREQWNKVLRCLLGCHTDNHETLDAWNVIRDDIFNRHFDPEAGSILSKLVQAGRWSKLGRIVLGQGVSVNEEDDELGTPLHVAIDELEFDVAYQLIELGADLNLSATYHGSALYEVCRQYVSSTRQEREREELLGYLIDHGADIDGGNTSSAQEVRNPLHACAERGDIGAATILLQRQANPNILRISTHHLEITTPLDTATKNGRFDLSELLLKAGAFSAIPGSTGYQGAIDLALERGFNAISELIQRHVLHNELVFQTSPGLRENQKRIINQIQKDAEDLREQYRGRGQR